MRPDWLASISELRGMTVAGSLMSHSTSTRSRLGCTVSTDPTGTPRICRHTRYRISALGGRRVSTRQTCGEHVNAPDVDRLVKTPTASRRLRGSNGMRDMRSARLVGVAMCLRTLTGVPTVIPQASGNSNIHCAAQHRCLSGFNRGGPENMQCAPQLRHVQADASPYILALR